jgi:hypothetical protein
VPTKSSVKLVNGQYVYTGIPLGQRLANRIRDPLGPVSTRDRSEYQTRYNASVRQEEISLVNKLIRSGAQFDEADMEALQNSKPGEILERVAARANQEGAVLSEDQRQVGVNPHWNQEINEKLQLQHGNQGTRSQIEALGGEAPE